MENLADVTAVVLAGGLGTRLRSVVGDRPKVLAEVAGRPFLAYLLDHLAGAGIRRAVLCTGYRAELVRAAFGERYAELGLRYSVESAPLGTGGALRAALPLLESPTVLVMNGDSYCEAELAAFFEQHRQAAAVGSLLLTRVANASRYGRVETDDSGRITQFAEKSRQQSPGWINAGIYLLQQELLDVMPSNETISLERQIFPAWIGSGLYGFKSGGRFIDIGVPEAFAKAADFFAT
jgi:D-glycero-alpha-D-manno-heptose 1-phosphate guanylyltransferase